MGNEVYRTASLLANAARKARILFLAVEAGNQRDSLGEPGLVS